MRDSGLHRRRITDADVLLIAAAADCGGYRPCRTGTHDDEVLGTVHGSRAYAERQERDGPTYENCCGKKPQIFMSPAPAPL